MTAKKPVLIRRLCIAAACSTALVLFAMGSTPRAPVTTADSVISVELDQALTIGRTDPSVTPATPTAAVTAAVATAFLMTPYVHSAWHDALHGHVTPEDGRKRGIEDTAFDP